MAIKTMAASSGGGDGKWTQGWHTLKIKTAEYNDWNGKRFVECTFDEYPANFTLRIYEAHNKETHEEFAIAKLFKLANAGIIDTVKSPSGKEAIQYDDDAIQLEGKRINVFFYKNAEGYNRISDRIAPVAQKGEILSYSDDDVSYWKAAAEKHYAERLLKADAPATNPTTNAEEIPF
jgi:hypothetical protein